jgi:hypothetical protein
MRKLLKKVFGAASEPLRPRSPRLRIPLADEAVFLARNGRAYPLRNLSETGLALLSPGERFPDEAGGEIRVGGEKVYVELLTVRRDADEVGLSIGDGAAGVRALLRRVFTDEFHALEMTEVDASRQKPVEQGAPRWFYAPGNYELFYVEHEGKLLRFEVEWNGRVLAHDGESLRFGTVSGEPREEVSHTRSALVRWESGVPDECRRKASRILENVPGLDAAARKQMQAILAG